MILFKFPQLMMSFYHFNEVSSNASGDVRQIVIIVNVVRSCSAIALTLLKNGKCNDMFEQRNTALCHSTQAICEWNVQHF